jgi:hypothetical protein
MAELQTLRADTRWLAKASDATVNYWKKKNATRVADQCALVLSPENDKRTIARDLKNPKAPSSRPCASGARAANSQ